MRRLRSGRVLRDWYALSHEAGRRCGNSYQAIGGEHMRGDEEADGHVPTARYHCRAGYEAA